MRSLAKSILTGICRLLVLPAVGMYRLHACAAGADNAFSGWSQLFSLIPGLSGVHLRHAFYRCTMKRCSDDVCISFGTIFSHPGVVVGRTAYIGNYCSIGDVTIGNDVLIASHVSIMNGCRQHGIELSDVPIREQTRILESVTIGDDSWIGERATIAADIGRHCVIGAGSVVLHPIPDYSVAVGVPARVIRDRRERRHAAPELVGTR